MRWRRCVKVKRQYDVGGTSSRRQVRPAQTSKKNIVIFAYNMEGESSSGKQPGDGVHPYIHTCTSPPKGYFRHDEGLYSIHVICPRLLCAMWHVTRVSSEQSETKRGSATGSAVYRRKQKLKGSQIHTTAASNYCFAAGQGLSNAPPRGVAHWWASPERVGASDTP